MNKFNKVGAIHIIYCKNIDNPKVATTYVS